MMDINGLRSTVLAVAGVMAMTASAHGQVAEGVDGAQLESWRLQSGNMVRYCTYENSPTAAFDQAVGEELAGRLLFDHSFSTLREGYGIGGEYAVEDLFIALTNECDVVLGMGLAVGVYPQEFTVTRPYVGFPYVLVVDDPDITALDMIPSDRRLGAPVGSFGLLAVMRYIATRAEADRWLMLPYGTQEQMLTRLLDGTIAGMVIYGPSFVALQREDARAADLAQLSLEPQVQARVEIGGLVLARNTFVRQLLDDAIASMVADGTIDLLLEDSGLSTIPHAAGGYID